MVQSKMTAEELAEIIEEAGYEVERYSGRNMYGKECPSFKVEHGEEYKAIAEIMFSYVNVLNDENKLDELGFTKLSELADTLGRVNRDDCGRSRYILYFPRIKYTEEQ